MDHRLKITGEKIRRVKKIELFLLKGGGDSIAATLCCIGKVLALAFDLS